MGPWALQRAGMLGKDKNRAWEHSLGLLGQRAAVPRGCEDTTGRDNTFASQCPWGEHTSESRGCRHVLGALG